MTGASGTEGGGGGGGNGGNGGFMLKAYHGDICVIIAFALTSLSTVVVALRFYARYYLVGKLSSSDWMMLLGVISTWGSAVVNYYQILYTDYTDAIGNMQRWKEIVVGSLLSFWIYRIFYIVDLFFIKMSILLFYNYVASAHKSFHYIVRTLMVVVCTSSFGMLLAAILSCNPPSDAWSFEVFIQPFYGTYATQCYNPTILWYFSAGFNLVTDTVIWFIPIPFVLNLSSMPLRRRFGLAGVFSIGTMAIAASGVRLWILIQWSSGWEKQGMNTANLLIWGQVEQHAGILSASIPFLRPISRKIKAMFTNCKREQPSPSPAAKLIAPLFAHDPNPLPPRTPIIPSPSPTFGSSGSEPSRAQEAPRPVQPMRSVLDSGNAY
ncbi:hypothetical protein BU24DRAFT_195363 [Aaosphaeria arxii CBS 175.79]|uniref:Rhodopsin domain-containing protein n=1 Tax=Aaosphaeria arxii CBS 175.79 TaxID=1450172 RepID=A0A6A5XSL3_9PLEO|nr:uncharacterized protein BU24DRAFT_195363 [Aaosphaeria arxii CBS 175.79]KAF2016172.1 hypothetical protein BU24DRAFT_195363 [Aaosphaeria arxii CBS 175.79]